LVATTVNLVLTTLQPATKQRNLTLIKIDEQSSLQPDHIFLQDVFPFPLAPGDFVWFKLVSQH